MKAHKFPACGQHAISNRIFVFLFLLLVMFFPARALAAEVGMVSEASYQLLAGSTSRTRVYSYEEGSLGFFDYLGSQNALVVVDKAEEDPTLAPYVDTTAAGQRTSPFNLDNVRQSIQVMRWCNELRRSRGLPELRVDPELVAISQCQLCFSNQVVGHSGVFMVGENLAWGYENPFDGWYYEEMEIWQRPENADARAWFDAYAAEHGFNSASFNLGTSPYASLSNEVGHYLNIINPEYVLTGASFIRDGAILSNVSGQVFSLDDSPLRTYTVDEFAQLFETYYASLGTPVEPLGYSIDGMGSYCELTGSQSIAHQGDIVYIHVAPLPSCEFSSLSIVDSSGGEVPYTFVGYVDGCREYSFTMPASDVNITATCTAIPNKINLVQGGHGAISCEAASAPYGDVVSVSVTPDEGFVAGALVVTDAQGNRVSTGFGDGNTRVFTMPGSAVSVSATWRSEGTMWPCGGDEFCPSNCFVDLSQDAWYHEGADWVLANGVMSGGFDPIAETGTFGATTGLTRAEMAQVLYNMAGRPEVDVRTVASFDDCSTDAWYAPAVAWVVDEGLFGGYSESSFGPGDALSREQFAVVVWRAEGEPQSQGELGRFSDVASVSSWARDAMSWSVGEGLISGLGSGELGPGVGLNRAMAATILQRWQS